MSDWRNRCAECNVLLPSVCNSCSTSNETYTNKRMMQERIADLEARLAAAEADAERLDWLEEKPYWVTVQSQPSGDFIHSGSGHGIRAAIDAALQATAQEDK